MWLLGFSTFVLLGICSVDALLTVIDPEKGDVIVDVFNDEPLVPFTSTIEGYIEPTNPPDACTSIAAPSFPTDFDLNKIALVNDTNCNWITKVCSAQAAGYDAVVIFRTPDFVNKFDRLLSDKKWNTSEHEECSFNITVTIVHYEDGIVIRDKYAYDSNVKHNYLVNIKEEDTPWPLKLILCFAFSTLPFLACFCVGSAFRYFKEKLRIRRENRASQVNLNKLFPLVKFREGDPYEDCAICWTHFTNGEKLRVLKCLHAYHPKCIDNWILKYQRKCPMCKRLVTLGDSFDATDSDPSESTPLLASSNASNYAPGPSTPNHHVGFFNVPGHAPENFFQPSANISIENSVNHDARPNSELSAQSRFSV
ncbi:hypothetical protein JTE90_005859 [Oedothorax gibbosus]|uniref:RING-type domain-containing protein n=1 Tax=Oedothorax gibbosus TaxID=931172 RepID=A0AAV6UPW2_9ARAC|nr:hypothetical protein JTE90_005859 [Oedothorax gibbosus]